MNRDKADQEKVLQEFIQPMRVYFGDPPGDDPAKVLALYIEALRYFPIDVLNLASKRLIFEAKRKTWPVIAECREMCVAAEASLRPKIEEPRKPQAPNEMWREHADVIAEMRLMSVTSRAIAEGWHGLLYDHLRARKCSPSNDDIAEMVRRKRICDETLDKLDYTSPLGVTLRKAYEAIEEKRGRIADEIRGRVMEAAE